MKLDQKEVEGGRRWFFGMGLFAIALSLGLRFVDDYLANSPKERQLGQTLSELRTAQTSLASRVDDVRQLGAAGR